MSRDICIYQEFLTGVHRAKIESAAAQAGFVPHFFAPDQFEEARECLQRCEVLYAHSPDLLRTAPASLKWYCCSYAGVDPYCKDPSVFANPDCMLTNSNSYGVTIAEHVVMVTLMLLRRMPEYGAIVRDREWSNQLPIRSIRDNEFTLLGTGNIGINVAERLRGMGAAKIIGLSRSGRAVPGFDAVSPISRLDEILPSVKVLIMSLPGTPETVHILNRDRIALLPRDAYVINVGRGTAIEQKPLIEALNSGRLAGAALDVMDPEPLPPDHPLWEAKNLILTPHVSGNMTLGYTCDVNVEMFCADLLRYGRGEPLKNLVDRTRGY
ncbi:D-2-hydroxyacid dehydrogenase [uncultured Oscillibacter sp.]|jgi:phosphoglycerate dehydrogenase-like enzyme|uniref:D-2-hydroxyacid dehydrogenase n=1 Tax=uncultured Oscillibacter sp. TaxID=876091 RepID=UPI0025D022E9|nr:D-2-hydroxyacid dehydrogenase [uncultured Oscillibacter sp.]